MTQASKSIGICLSDALLSRLVCDGLRRHALVTISKFVSVADMLDAAGNLAIAVFDAEDISADSFTDQGVVPLKLVDRKTTTATKEEELWTLPIRLGTFIDTIRRSTTTGTSSQPFQLGAWLVSADGSTLTDRTKGKTVRLTEKERDILMSLRKKMGDIVDRQELLNEIWGYGKGIETHTLETHIYRLRRKIEKDPARPQWLITEGAGYRLESSRTADHNP